MLLDLLYMLIAWPMHLVLRPVADSYSSVRKDLVWVLLAIVAQVVYFAAVAGAVWWVVR